MKSFIKKDNRIAIIKNAIKPFLLMTLFAVVLAIVILDIYNKSEIQAFKNIEKHSVKVPAITLKNDIKEVSSDVYIMANQRHIGDSWNDDNTLNEEFRNELSEYFLSISIAKKKYDQLRLINKDGLEIIRINFNGDPPYIIPKEDLQDKKGRYYFEDAISLKRGEIYISPLDLNIEYGKVEQPFKPMIRIATPFFSKNGEKKGIVLLNYFGTNLLEKFKIHVQASNTNNIMLLNSDGYWLSAVNSEDEWGFMLDEKKDITFANRYSQAWRTIKSQKSGQFQIDAGLFTFETIYPLTEGQVSSTGAGEAFLPSKSMLNSNEYYWKIVSFVPTEQFTHNSVKRRSIAIYSLIILSLIFLFLSLLFSFNLCRRKTAELTVKRSEEKFKGLFTGMSHGVVFCEAIYDENKNMVDCIYRDMNKSYEKFTNLNKELAIDNKVLEMLPGTEQEWFSTFGEVVKNGKSISIEMYNKPTKKYYSVFAYRAKKDNFVAIFEDVTERKQAEEDLIIAKEKAESTEIRFRAIIEQAAEGITIADLDGNYLLVNSVFCEMTGYSNEELLDMKVFEMLVNQDVNDIEAELFGFHNEYTLKRKDDSTFPVLIIVSPIKIGSETILLGMVTDITERKRAEEELKAANQQLTASQEQILSNESFLKSILDSIQDGISVFDIELTVQLTNKKMNEWYKGSQLKGRKCYEVYHNRTEICDPCPVSRSLKSGKKESDIVSGLPGSPIKWIELFSYPIKDRTGKITGVAEFVRNITDSKQAEEDLIAAKEKAEESNRLKTAFLNNMSHEIRTPLNGITGFLGLLQEPDIEKKDRQQYFDIINKSSHRLITTVTDIIEISKIEAGLIEVIVNKVSVNEMLNELYDFFSLEANKKGLNLMQFPSLSDDKSIVLCDNNKLNGILTNLVKNAIKFTNKGSVTFGYNLTSDSESGSLIQFYVKDTGIGIPKNRKQAIFNRFEQADIEDTKVFEGSGLGLAIAKSYVEMLGGKIWVKTEESVGSEFMFTIPYKTKNNITKKEE